MENSVYSKELVDQINDIILAYSDDTELRFFMLDSYISDIEDSALSDNLTYILDANKEEDSNMLMSLFEEEILSYFSLNEVYNSRFFYEE